MTGAGSTAADHGALLALPQLAELAGVSISTLRREIAAGRLPALKVGRLLRVRLTDWQAYLDAKRVQARPEPLPPAKPRTAAAGAPR